MNELGKRVLLAFIAAPLFIFLIWLGGWYFRVLMVAISLLIQHEMLSMLRKAGMPGNPVFTYLFGIWLLGYSFWPYAGGIGLAILVALFITETLRPRPEMLKTASATLFCGFYAPAGLLTFQWLRFSEGPWEGFIVVLGLLLMVWGNDTFAYFTGKKLGKHPLAPAISPKKTWEGFLGGILGAAAGLFLVWLVFKDSFPFSLAVSIGLVIVVSIFGPAGDLVESQIKREAGVKDSGVLLPGHGGFFDRFDALLLSSVAVSFYLGILYGNPHGTF